MNRGYSDEEFKGIVHKILNLCIKYNKIPSIKIIINKKIIGDIRVLNRYFINLGYSNWMDYFRDMGYGTDIDFKINGKYKKPESLDDIYFLISEYISTYKNFPSTDKMNKKYNLPSYSTLLKILKSNKKTLHEIQKEFGFNNFIYTTDNYNDYVKLFIEISKNRNIPILQRELISNEWNLPSSEWFIRHCPNKNVKTYGQFLEYINIKPVKKLSKELVIKTILEMQLKLDRPLMYNDFKNPDNDEIGISVIKKFWGSMNKMKEELGLEITQEDMTCKYININDIKEQLYKLCNEIYDKEKRKIICKNDINNCDFIPNYQTCQKYLKREYKNGIRDYIKLFGFDFLKSGSGLVYEFKDGEKTSSQFEYYFSNFLRKIGFDYNINYFRDIKYKKFINNYKGNMNCDYVINYKGGIVYVEIAGILERYKEQYLNNTEILVSKSKEKYRLKLMEKEKMLKDNNLEYYILFPSDIQEDFLLSIFNN